MLSTRPVRDCLACSANSHFRVSEANSADVVQDRYFAKVSQESPNKKYQQERNSRVHDVAQDRLLSLPSLSLPTGSPQILVPAAAGKGRTLFSTQKRGAYMLQIGDGTVICFKFSEGQVDACASQCQQGRAHARQWCLEPHRNERCQSEAAIAARTQGFGEGSGKSRFAAVHSIPQVSASPFVVVDVISVGCTAQERTTEHGTGPPGKTSGCCKLFRRRFGDTCISRTVCENRRQGRCGRLLESVAKSASEGSPTVLDDERFPPCRCDPTLLEVTFPIQLVFHSIFPRPLCTNQVFVTFSLFRTNMHGDDECSRTTEFVSNCPHCFRQCVSCREGRRLQDNCTVQERTDEQCTGDRLQRSVLECHESFRQPFVGSQRVCSFLTRTKCKVDCAQSGKVG